MNTHQLIISFRVPKPILESRYPNAESSQKLNEVNIGSIVGKLGTAVMTSMFDEQQRNYWNSLA